MHHKKNTMEIQEQIYENKIYESQRLKKQTESAIDKE